MRTQRTSPFKKLSEPSASPSSRCAASTCGVEIELLPGRLLPRYYSDHLCPECFAEREPRRLAATAARIDYHLERAGVMPEHIGAELEAHWPERASDVVAWCESDSPGLLINGAYGRGKSHLAAAVTRYFVLRGIGARFSLARELLREIRATFGDDATETEGACIERLCRVPLLVIDDLGPGREGRGTEFVLGTLHEILSKRIGYQRPTVVTTNLTRAQVESEYGGAIASRLGRFETLTMTGVDRRRHAA